MADYIETYDPMINAALNNDPYGIVLFKADIKAIQDSNPNHFNYYKAMEQSYKNLMYHVGFCDDKDIIKKVEEFYHQFKPRK